MSISISTWLTYVKRTNIYNYEEPLVVPINSALVLRRFWICRFCPLLYSFWCSISWSLAGTVIMPATSNKLESTELDALEKSRFHRRQNKHQVMYFFCHLSCEIYQMTDRLLGIMQIRRLSRYCTVVVMQLLCNPSKSLCWISSAQQGKHVNKHTTYTYLSHPLTSS